MSEELKPDRIIAIARAFMASKTLLSAVALGVFAELADGTLDAATLRERIKIHPRAARDFFDALVAMRVLDRERDRYANTPESALFLDPAKPSYVGGLLEMANARLYPSWASLTKALRTGKPQNELPAGLGKGGFEELYADPTRLRGFLRAMTGTSIAPAKAIAVKFPWQRYETLIDVGTAQGCLPVQVALAHPHLSASGFDLAPVRPIFEDYVGSFGLSGRVRFIEGNFFTDPLPAADVLVMGKILHDWNLDEKRMLLDKALQALSRGGALIVYENLIDDERRENLDGLVASLNMLIETPGGFDYTGADCRGWMRDVGFSESYVEHLGGPVSMVVGIK